MFSELGGQSSMGLPVQLKIGPNRAIWLKHSWPHAAQHTKRLIIYKNIIIQFIKKMIFTTSIYKINTKPNFIFEK